MTLKRRLPFLRWSVLRFAWSMPAFVRTGQFGDGREAAVAADVEANARAGDVDDVLATMDRFAYEKSMLVNVGDEKGALLDAAVRRADPRRALELGAYCGYSALRIARAAPAAEVYSVEFSAANADIARRIWRHAGVADRITCVVGTLGDGGATLDTLAAHGFAPHNLDLLFIDHDKRAYLPDLQRVLHRDWLHPRVDRGRRQRPRPRSPEIPRSHAGRAGQDLRHRGAPHPRRVPDAARRPGARIRIPRLTSATAREGERRPTPRAVHAL